ncbi:microsomal triacylglycerol transfer protein [Halyomorpha halys]|uniref:microsomal triacylglycerol transfer protein n=1 Tax=Halyomorpha halys TaxID=286706 RepID=UPI0006D5083E|nr:microsomal triglyceride transfer protein large subunit [Halyomorpha halys]
MITYCVLLILAISKVSSVIYGGSYKFYSTLELSDSDPNPVGYQITAATKIQQINPQVLLVKLEGIKLHFATKKLPNANFKESKSTLDSAESTPFLIEISDGVVKQLYISSDDDPSILSIKKGLASLLQFQIKSSNGRETDSSGTCDVKYEVIDNSQVNKFKSNCQNTKESNLWGGNIVSSRSCNINLENGAKLLSVISKEEHILKPSLSDFDVHILSKMELVYEADYASKHSLGNSDIKTIISNAEKEFGHKYTAYGLSPSTTNTKQKKISTKLSAVVKDNTKGLSEKEFGTKTSAISALNILSATKGASYDDIYKTLKSKSSKKIRGQLVDILGGVQTEDSHKAAMTFLNMTSKNHNLDLCERYLWALSISPAHDKNIIQDLLKLSQEEISDLKLYETLIQTVSSMVRKYSEDTNNNELLEEALELFTEKLKKCKKDDDVCHRIYLKAFKNIASPKALNIILEYALNGSPSVGMRAMRALWSLGKNSWNKEVIKTCERILLTNGTYDSSAKTIALDILLESNPSDLYLAKVLSVLRQKGNLKELREYMLQRLVQISEKNKSFEKQLKSIFPSEGLNHYNYLAQGGLSTAFERRFMEKGFLSTTQEVMSGILKQGYVHVNLEENDNVHTVFTLGLFSNGLASFISSDEGSGDSDVVNAGLELTVNGVEFRPFIFFEGNGELMGHVFSGTGSTLTPAYQAVLLLEDDLVKIPLAIGQIVDIKFSSVASVDLSGKIEISLWGRTADSLVQNRAGIIKRVVATVASPFIECEIKHDVTAEPQLSLTSYIEFYDKMALCLQLQQPQTVIEHTSNKHESILGTKQKVNKSRIIKTNVPGKSYALNSKNNEMCNVLYPSS